MPVGVRVSPVDPGLRRVDVVVLPVAVGGLGDEAAAAVAAFALLAAAEIF